jgi:PAS domain S-box-containing protein
LSNIKIKAENNILLYFTPEIEKGKDLFLQLFGEVKNGSERRFVSTITDFSKAIEAQTPDVVVINHTSSFNYTEAALKIMDQNELDLPFILLIDTVSENEVIDLFSKGLDDYVFLDRPNRLPVSIRKIRKKYLFKAERGELEARIVLNDRKFKGLIENSADAILILNPDGRKSYISPAAERILGYSEGEAKELNFYSLIHPEDQCAVEEGFRACLEMPGIPLSGFPVRVKGKSDGYHWLEATFTNLLDEPGINGIVANFRDISHHKQAELSIKESEEKYRSFFEHSVDGILLTVTDGRILAANPAACRMLQMTEEEICEAGRFGIVDPEDKRVGVAIKERQKKGHVKAEVTFIRKDGSKFPGEVTSSVFICATGEKRTSMIIRDLSERVKAEEEKEIVLQKLRAQSEKLQTAQRIAKLGYWEQDLENNSLFWTEEVYRIWGRDRTDFPPSFNSLLKTIYPKDLDKFLRENSSAMAGLRNLDLEHRIVLPNGSVKWVHERGALTFTESGKRIFEGTVQDITEEKLNRQRLITSEARVRGILKSQTNYLIRVDLAGNYSFCNDKFLKDFSWIFEDKNPIGKLALSSVEESSHNKLKEVFRKCLSQPNTVVQVEIEKLQKEGDKKFTFWDFICVTDPEGNPVEIQGVGIDITDRIKAERSLLESNQRYQLVTKATSDAIYDWDCKTGKIVWSDNYCKLFGYSSDLAPADCPSWALKVHPEDQHILEELYSVLEGAKKFWKAEYRYCRHDGTFAHVLEKGTIIRNSEGEAIRMVGALRDISERKEAMQKLMRSEARHRGIIQSQTNYVVRIDLQGNYSYCNRKFVENFSWIYEKEELLGEDSMISVMSYHHERLAEVSQKCLSSPGEVFQVELDKPGKNDRVKKTLWDIVYLADTTHENGELQCVGIDITARVKAEQENLFQANLLDKIGQAVIATDSEGIITYWNRAASEIYGWAMEEVLGKNILRVTPSLKSRKEGKTIMKTLKQGKTWSGEFLVRRKSGAEFHAQVTNSPFFDENGKFKGVIGISSDITERKIADNKLLNLNKSLRNYTKELVAANKGLEQFSYIVSHNLRAPVANIIGLGDLINNEDYPDDLKQQLLEEIINNIGRLDSIIKDLNDILKVKEDISEKREKIDLNNLVKTIISGVERLIDQEEVRVITNFSEVPEFNAPKSYLHSIFSNLILNSIKYRRPDVDLVLELSSKVKDGKVIFEFLDNGMGIDLEKKGNQIFGLYKRFHSHVEGKGMGLFMVKTQVELMGGKISVDSRVNEGSRFVLEFKEEKINVINEDEEKETVHFS